MRLIRLDTATTAPAMARAVAAFRASWRATKCPEGAVYRCEDLAKRRVYVIVHVRPSRGFRGWHGALVIHAHRASVGEADAYTRTLAASKSTAEGRRAARERRRMGLVPEWRAS